MSESVINNEPRQNLTKRAKSRQIFLDTETTGLETRDGHRIIEIGCVEMIDRKLTGNNYHQYLQPDRESDEAALEVHGITSEFLADKPRFADVVSEFIAYVSDAELIIHNAPFDVGFINYELSLLDGEWEALSAYCEISDSLVMARQMHPGQRNTLDALCKRYDVNNAHRELHGALLDSEILADVYLAMTGGQTALLFNDAKNGESGDDADNRLRRLNLKPGQLAVHRADVDEMQAHKARLEAIEKVSGKMLNWSR